MVELAIITRLMSMCSEVALTMVDFQAIIISK